MPPRGVTSPKRKRQYEHIKDSELDAGRGEDRAEEIAARTVNKQRRQAGETQSSRTSGAGTRTRASSRSKTTGAGSRKTTRADARKTTRSSKTSRATKKR